MTKRNFQAKEYAAEQQASYIEDIASQLRDLGDDYARLLNEREKLRDRIAQLETEKELKND